MTENWNFLLKHAGGKYITFVGDDDAFIPSELCKLENFASKVTVDLIWTRPAGYGWPFENKVGNFYQVVDKSSRIKNLKKLRKKILNMNHRVDLPIPYNRVIFHRNILDNFWKDYPEENFCNSRIPDISSAVKIALLSNSQINYNHTVFISGTCQQSNGLLTRNGSKLNKKYEFNNLIFNPILIDKFSKIKQAPPFGFMTWYEAYHSSIIQLNTKSTCPEWRVAFQSVLYSSNARVQKEISFMVWANYKIFIYLGFIFNQIKLDKLILLTHRVKFNLFLVIKIILNRGSVIIVSGKQLNSSEMLVNFLEQSKILSTEKSITRIHTI
jgi:hypothetical protein